MIIILHYDIRSKSRCRKNIMFYIESCLYDNLVENVDLFIMILFN